MGACLAAASLQLSSCVCQAKRVVVKKEGRQGSTCVERNFVHPVDIVLCTAAGRAGLKQVGNCTGSLQHTSIRYPAAPASGLGCGD